MSLESSDRGAGARRRGALQTEPVAARDAPSQQTSNQRPAIVYVINAFDQGGAESGLITLVESGLFDGCRLTVVALVRGTGGLEAKLLEMGHRPCILVDRQRMRSRDLLLAFPLLWRLIRRERPHIVIGSLPQANLLARLCVALDRRITFISFEHNSHLAKRVYEAGYRLTSRRVDWMFADAASTMTAADARLYRRTPKRRTVVPLVCFGAPATRLYSPSEGCPFHVINAARFTATKNQAALIEAAALLARRGRDIALTLYGDGGERSACQALAEGLGIGQRVLFPGFVQDWATRGGDLFVLTSKHEGLCVVALEAMHAGIPVVAPRIGGLTAHADAGLIRDLESVDPQVVADAIAAAMDDSVTTATMVARAAGMVDECFGAEAIRHDYAGINQALLAAVHGPTGSRRAGAPRTRRTFRDANNAR